MGDPLLLRALRREPTPRPPVWFMRQAGRFLGSYQALRRRHSLLDLCRSAELAAQVTMLPIRELPGLDAAILFSDLLVVLQPMGLQVEYVQSEGPVIVNPVASRTDIEALKPVDPARDMSFVAEAIRIVKRELGGALPLIGFGGAPFTLASYVIEGGASRNHTRTKALMASDPAAWDLLMRRLVDAVSALLRAQVEAGADAIQVFDSWAGALSPEDYRDHVLPHSKRLIASIRPPVIHFATGTAGFLELQREAGGDAIGIDWRIPIDQAWVRLGDVAVMGNLDPAALLGPREALLRRVDEVLERAAGRAGHIFNLGHGVLPETPVDHVLAVIERVRRGG